MANERPTLTNPTAPATFVENGTPVRIVPDATIFDDDNMRGGRIVVYGLRIDDRITLFDTGADFTIGRVGDELVLHFGPGNYRTLGSITGGVGAPLVIQLNDLVTNSDVQAALRQLQYGSVSDDPATQVTLNITVTDRYGDSSGLVIGQTPSFAAAAPENNPFTGMTVGSYAAPVAYDVAPNADGLVDLVVGRGDTSSLSIVKNLGGGAFQLQQTGYYTSQETPFLVSAAVDIDGDGNIDLISADRNGRFVITYNRVSYTEGSSYQTLVNTGSDHIAPAFADFNNDGRLDLVVGDASGRITIFRGSGGTQFTNGTIASPFPDYSLTGERYSAPTFYDVDSDGDLDALITTTAGLHYLRNDGGVFSELTGSDNPFAGFAIPGRSKVTFLDVNADGARDLVVGKPDGTIDVFLSTAKYGVLVPVTITPIDDNPVIDLNGAAAGRDVTVSFVEQSMSSIKPGAAATFADPDWRGGTMANPVKLTIDLIAFKPGDAFSFGGLEDGQQLSYLGQPFATFAQDPISGRFDIVLVPGAPQAGLQELIRQFTFVNATGVLAPGARSVVFTLADEFGKSTSATATVNAVPFNSVATVNAPALTTLNLSEKAATATQIFASHVIVSDVENDFNGGDLTVAGVAVADSVTLRTQGTGAGQLSLANGVVSYGGIAIGTLTGGNGSTFKIAFNDAASSTAVSAVYDNLMYQNVGADPSATHTLRVTLTDGAAKTTGVAGPGNVVTGADVKVNLTLINDYFVLDLNALDGPAATGGSTGPLGEVSGQYFMWQNATVTDPDALGYPWLRQISVSIANATPNDNFYIDENGGEGHIFFKMRSDSASSDIQINIGRDNYRIGSVAKNSGANGTAFVITLPAGVPADWVQQIVRAFRYENNSVTPPTDPRDISVKFTWEDSVTQTAKWAVSITDNPPTLDLDTGATGLGSAVSYTENLAPVAIAKAPLWSEGGATITVKSITAAITANGSTDDRLALNPAYIVRGDTVVVNGIEVGTVSGGGTTPVVITFNGVGLDGALAKLALANITFANGSEDPATSQRTVTFTTVHTGGKTATATATVDVVATIDRPAVLDLNSADGATVTSATASYIELAAAVRIAPNATVIDADLPIVTGRTLTVSISAGGTTDDRLSIINAGTGTGQVGVSGNNLSYGGVAIGTFTGGGASPIVVTFIDGTSKAAVAGVTAAIGFSNASIHPTNAVRTVTFVGEFSQGETSTATATINVTDVLNVPILDLNSLDGGGTTGTTLRYTGTAGAVVIAPLASLSAPGVDPNNMSLTVAITANGTADDRLAILNTANGAGMVGASGSSVLYGGAPIGTVSGGSGTTPLVIQFYAGTPTSMMLEVAKAITFSTSMGGSTAARTITFNPQVTEGGIASSATVTIVAPTAPTPVLDLNSADGAALTGFIGRLNPAANSPTYIAPAPSLTSADVSTLRTGELIVTIENAQVGDSLRVIFPGTFFRIELLNDTVSSTTFDYVEGSTHIQAGTLTGNRTTSLDFKFNYAGSNPAGVVALLLQQLALTTTSTSDAARSISVAFDAGAGGVVIARSLLYAGMAPVLDLNGVVAAGTNAAATYVDRSGPTAIAPVGVLVDSDSADLRGSMLTVALTANATAADRLSIIHSGNGAGQIGVSGSTLTYGGAVIGSFTGGVGAAPLVVTLNGAPKAATEALLQAIGFSNLSNQASLATRTASFTLTTTDGTVTATATVAFAASTDAPTLLDLNLSDGTATLGSAAAYTLTGAPVAIAPQGGIADADSPGVRTSGLRFTLTTNANASDSLTIAATGSGATAVAASGGSLSYGGAVIGSYTGGTGTTPLVIIFDGAGAARAAVDAVVRSIVFSNPSGNAPASVRTYDAVATYEGGYTSTASGTVVVNPLPSAVADAAAVFADKTVAIAVLANDLTVGGVAPSLAQVNNTAIAVNATVTLASGARVTRLADGTLRYDPNGAFATLISTQKAAATGSLLATQATDSFTYTLADGTQATVSVTVNGADVPLSIADVATVAENATTTITVLANDIDYDGPALSIARINGAVASIGQAISLASGATVTLKADGTIDYNPNGKFAYLVSSATAAVTGAIATAADSFTYTPVGGVATTVVVTVAGIDGAGDQLRGTIGNETITGTIGADYIDISQGGTDIVNANAGADLIFAGAGFDSTDRIDGDDGYDQVGLRGSYTGSLGGIINTEYLALLSGTSTRFGGDGTARYTYNLTTTDATVATGVAYVVQANELVAGENLRFDGSAERDGSFLIYAGKGIDMFIGGSGDDGFFFGEGGRFTAADQVNGGAGTADQLGLRGNYTVTFGATTVTNVETIVLLSAIDVAAGIREASAYSYNLVLNDGNVAAGQTLKINAAQLGATESATVNGGAETAGNLFFIGGAGNDTFTGGGGTNTFYGGGGADRLNGGSGIDTYLYRAASESAPAARDTIDNFRLGDRIDLSVIDAVNGGGDDAFTWINSGAFVAGTPGQLRMNYVSGFLWTVEGDIDGDGTADFQLNVYTDHTITAADFIL